MILLRSRYLIETKLNSATSLILQVYKKMSLILTDYENPRTQTEYENSYAIKVFVFEFINFYGSLLYIAFFKGAFMGHPLQTNDYLHFEKDYCDPAGCLSELCIQLAVIMSLKQTFGAIMEYGGS